MDVFFSKHLVLFDDIPYLETFIKKNLYLVFFLSVLIFGHEIKKTEHTKYYSAISLFSYPHRCRRAYFPPS